MGPVPRIDKSEVLSSKNDEEAFEGLLELATSYSPRVFVKISALFRLSKKPFPHADLRLRVLALLRTVGSTRMLWGSDFPFVMLGGHALNEESRAPSYADASTVFDRWNEQSRLENRLELVIPESDILNLLGGTARALFRFD